MKLFRSLRWILMALMLSVIPASSYAGVFISVGFAPPVLPVYEQPACPEPGWMWTPGYWAYGPDGYYWVPGTWVPAPYEGALWTPPYWGWSGGLYMFHPGYWGRHVGYYGGVNYGFGYMGIGFVGGRWHGRDFEYNTAVMRVDNVHVRNVYVDRTVVVHNTIVNDRHVAYSGGPGGINHQASGEERAAMHEQHMAPTSFQTQHSHAAMSDHNSYARTNGGHPQNLAAARPMPEPRGGANNMRQGQQGSFNNRGGASGGNAPQARPNYQNNRPMPQSQPRNESRPMPQGQPRNESRPMPQAQPRNESRPTPQYQPRNESRPMPQAQPRNEPRPAPQPRNESRPAPQQRQQPQGHPEGGQHPQHDSHNPRGR